jgi:hypothetical protein
MDKGKKNRLVGSDGIIFNRKRKVKLILWAKKMSLGASKRLAVGIYPAQNISEKVGLDIFQQKFRMINAIYLLVASVNDLPLR